MKNKLLLMVMLFVIAMPIVIATEDDSDDNEDVIFKYDIIKGTTKSFDYAASDDDKVKPVAISVKEIQKAEKRCRILFQEEDLWLDEGKEVIAQSYPLLRVRIKNIEENLCAVEVRSVKDNIDDISEDAHAYITSLNVDNYQANSQGYIYVENGAKVVFVAKIESDAAVNDVPYVFYNNGYQTGKGATDKLTGTVDLKKGVNYLDFAMVFNYEDDTLYKTGSFITLLLLDPEEHKIDKSSYHGITIYVKNPGQGPYVVSQKPSLPQEPPFLNACEEQYKICIENRYDVDVIEEVNEIGLPEYYQKCQEQLRICNGELPIPTYPVDPSKDKCKEQLRMCLEDYSTYPQVAPPEDTITETAAVNENIVIDSIEDIDENKCYEQFRICGGDYSTLPSIAVDPSEGYTEPRRQGCDLINGNIYSKCIKQGFDEYYCREIASECENNGGYTEPYGKSCNQGCYANSDINKCLPYGTRLEQKGTALYCNIDGSLQEQRNDGDAASNDYECKSNSARYGTCENVAEQNDILTKIFGWLSRFFGG